MTETSPDLDRLTFNDLFDMFMHLEGTKVLMQKLAHIAHTDASVGISVISLFQKPLDQELERRLEQKRDAP